MKDHIYFLKRGFVYTSPCIACTMHIKFYVAILLALERKPFTVKIGERTITATALAMRAGTKFSFSADDTKYLSVFVEPTHPMFARFHCVPAIGLLLNRASFAELNIDLRQAYEGSACAERVNHLFDEVVRIAGATLPLQPPLDERVAKTLQLMDGDSAYSLEDLAGRVGLSYYRLSHLFSERLGISLRYFMQWRKVTITASLLATQSITDVAHEAGFTDSAHLSRTFQSLYGVPPSYLNDARCVERFYFQQRHESMAGMKSAPPL